MRNGKIYIDGMQYGMPAREYFEEVRDTGLDMFQITTAFWENISETMRNLGEWYRLFDIHSDLIYPALAYKSLSDEIGKTEKVAVLFGFQNCSPIENNIDMVELYKNLNVGVMQLSYNNHSPLCGGCYEKEDRGLSRFGRAVIREMNRVGMLIDMSHSSDKSTLQAIECSERPICITHGQSLHFRKSVRNKPDSIIRAICESGGMMGLSLYPFHLRNVSDCTITEMMDEIKRLVDIVGVDSLAFGTDLCQGRSVKELEFMRNGHWTKVKDYGEGSPELSGWPTPVSWYERISDFKNLETSFLENGFSDNEVRKIMGENWHRFFQDVLKPQV